MSEVLNETVQPAEQTTPPATAMEEVTQAADGQQAEGEATRNKELPPEVQVAFGKAMKAERAKINARFEADYQQRLQQMQMQMQQMPQTQGEANNNAIYDPDTGEYVDINSPVGQVLARNMKAAQIRTQRVKAVENQSLQDKLQEGHIRYENYQGSLDTFIQFGTDVMAETLKGCDDPTAVVQFLADHPEELKRIAQLPPARQAREVFSVESRIKPAKRLVSNAPAPINTANETRNTSAQYESLSFEEKKALVRERSYNRKR